MADLGERCVPVVDEHGQVVASARVSGELDAETWAALQALVVAARRAAAELDAAGPGVFGRDEAAVERIRAKVRRARGGEP